MLESASTPPQQQAAAAAAPRPCTAAQPKHCHLQCAACIDAWKKFRVSRKGKKLEVGPAPPTASKERRKMLQAFVSWRAAIIPTKRQFMHAQ